MTENKVFFRIGEYPSSDDYHFFRGTDYDELEVSIIDRYRKYNNMDGNSRTSNSNIESYQTCSTQISDDGDLNNNEVLDRKVDYIQFEFELTPEKLEKEGNHIVGRKEIFPDNGDGAITWYKFSLPITRELISKLNLMDKHDGMQSLRMVLTGFSEEVHLRIAFFDLRYDVSKIQDEYCNKFVKVGARQKMG